MSAVHVHPGVILAEEMESRGLAANALALKLRTNRQAISDVVAGKRAVTPVMALRLGRYFGIGPEFWLSLQMNFALHQAEKRMGKRIAKDVERAA